MSEPITEKQLNDAITHAELRFRRMWRDDFAAALRGQLNDLVAHFETRLEAKIRAIVTDKLAASVAANQSSAKALLAMVESDRGYWDRYRAALANEVKGIVIDVLQEYGILDENLYPVVPPAVAKAGN